jgi:hypothetical protein
VEEAQGSAVESQSRIGQLPSGQETAQVCALPIPVIARKMQRQNNGIKDFIAAISAIFISFVFFAADKL